MSRKKIVSLVFILLNCSVNAENLTVYTESLPPFQYIEANEITGSATEQVIKLLNSSNLSYEFHLVPWARAYNLVKTTPDTLIYSINRTPEREPYFHWIKVVANISNSFISLNSNNLIINQIDDVKKYAIAVVRDGYAYDTLLSQGFVVNENLYVVSTLDQQVSLLINKKVDFLFTDEQSIKYKLMQQNIDPCIVKSLYTQPTWSRDLYLAANINTSPTILKKLYDLSPEK